MAYDETGLQEAAGSIVNREYPSNAIIAGAPTRVVREGIYWRR